jgi:hypothetical protein
LHLLVEFRSYLEHVTIDYIKCETGKATVKLKLKSKLGELFEDLASGFKNQDLKAYTWTA